METFKRLRREAPLANLGLHLAKEVLRQEADVVGTDAQGWDLDHQAMDSIVEVRAEATLVHHRTQISVRCANQPNVDAAGCFTANAPDMPSFQHAKEPSLQARRQLCDFIEKERPAVRLLERSAMRLDRAGERPSLVSKELALNELARKTTAVERHERALAAPPSFVKRPRDVLFADACFASNEDRPGQVRESIHLGHDGQHGARFDDDLRRGCPTTTDHTELGSAEAHHGPWPKLMAADAQAVDPRAVGAVEIANGHAS